MMDFDILLSLGGAARADLDHHRSQAGGIYIARKNFGRKIAETKVMTNY